MVEALVIISLLGAAIAGNITDKLFYRILTHLENDHRELWEKLGKPIALYHHRLGFFEWPIRRFMSGHLLTWKMQFKTPDWIADDPSTLKNMKQWRISGTITLLFYIIFVISFVLVTKKYP